MLCKFFYSNIKPLLIFYNKFLSVKDTIKTKIYSTSYNIMKIFNELNKTQKLKKEFIDITNFLNLFIIKHPNFGYFKQNDAQEFYRVILEDISSENK